MRQHCPIFQWDFEKRQEKGVSDFRILRCFHAYVIRRDLVFKHCLHSKPILIAVSIPQINVLARRFVILGRVRVLFFTSKNVGPNEFLQYDYNGGRKSENVSGYPTDLFA
jgi:hypothetical protein